MEPVQLRLEACQSAQQDLRASARHGPNGLAPVPAVESQRDHQEKRPRVPSTTPLAPPAVPQDDVDRSPVSIPRHDSFAKPAKTHSRLTNTEQVVLRLVDRSNDVAAPHTQAAGFDLAP